MYFEDETEGAWSPYVFAITNDFPAAPTAVRVLRSTTSSITLTWTPPQYYGRTPIRKYEVEYEYENETHSFHTNNRVPKVTVRDLPPNACLRSVVVAAINDVGEGPPAQVR